ncbi:MAG: hypothetical protein IJ428_01405 [Clostridia bacterium]|nr:hypothetical protein [Clostridia bacterium]
MAVDYSILLTKGTSGIKKHIDVLLTSCKDDSKREFYETCKACLNAVERFSERYADRARQLAVDAESERKAEFLRIAEICERVPKYPAESFYEAVQSINFRRSAFPATPQDFTSARCSGLVASTDFCTLITKPTAMRASSTMPSHSFLSTASA